MKTNHHVFRDYRSHKCLRDCSNTRPLECIYDFDIEYWSVLTRNCFNCSTSTPSDCFRPHCVQADGVKRAIKTVNRMLPGPSIQVCAGDTIVVNVANRLFSYEATTIHWHGIHITPSMDGVAMITQCPITPDTTFQYRFKVPNPGTHWWHAHSSGQRADGVFGSLIVRQANDPNSYLYDYDLAEHVIVMNDWLDQLFITKFSSFEQDGGEETASSILINGRGGDTIRAGTGSSSSGSKRNAGHGGHHKKAPPPPPPDWSMPPPSPFDNHHHHNPELPRSEFVVAKGRRYRFRMINAGISFCPLQISIDRHVLTIIALDGNPVEPFQVTSFFILAGERVDFVLTANAYADAYWIKAQGHGDCEDNKIFQTAILRYGTSMRSRPMGHVTYDTAGPSEPGLTFNPFNTIVTAENRSSVLFVDEARSKPDELTKETLARIRQPPNRKFYLSLDMNFVKNPVVYDDSTFGEDASLGFPQFTSAQINNITFMMPSTPLIYQYKKLPPEEFCNQDERELACPDSRKFCSCVHAIRVNLNDVVELIIVDGGSQQENHPFHLHGFSFGVLGVEKLGPTAFMPDIKQMDQMGKLKRNLEKPPLKDTVTIPSGGYTIVRYHANNPGVWVMHCHIEFHMEMGMMLLFHVGQDSQLPPIDLKSWPQCGNVELNPVYDGNKKKQPAVHSEVSYPGLYPVPWNPWSQRLQ